MQITPDPITVCDLDGHTADDPEAVAFETYRFWHEGRELELDVCLGHNTGVMRAIAAVNDLANRARAVAVQHRRGGGPARALNPARSTGRSNAATRRRSAALREWAQGQGIELSPKGRIPASVNRAYDEAMAGG